MSAATQSAATRNSVSTAVTDLQRRLDAGEVQLSFNPESGYLPALLEQLRISPASQLLVFSKTSCQREKISPRTPRAIYFNDQASIAWIPSSHLLEISAVDPRRGPVFYTLDQAETAKPRILRRDNCLECHTSNKTMGVPGYLVRSYRTDSEGVVDITDGWSMVDHRTPFAARWGGWSIDATAEALRHGAEVIQRGSEKMSERLSASSASSPPQANGHLPSYPRPGTDSVALMVLEHQAHMHNLITRMQYDSAEAANLSSGKIDAFVKYLLFAEEVPLPMPLKAKSEFVTWFESQGPHDQKGRSLRQFDLETRLFKYPCSYLIYSDAFNLLPRRTKLRIYHRLWSVLKEGAPDPAFALPSEKKEAILQILLETKSDLPVAWKL